MMERLSWLLEDQPEVRTIQRAFPGWVLIQYLCNTAQRMLGT
jgi:hypothetical protein